VFARCPYRHSCEWYIRGSAIVSRSECQSERTRCYLCILVEHLVELTHPEKKNCILVPGFDLPVLLHQRSRCSATHSYSAFTTNPLICFALSERITALACDSVA